MVGQQRHLAQSFIHQLFEAQVEQTPDAIAITFEGRPLTYQELNIRANQLAHYLHKRGIEPEMLVGICVERSLDLIVGILGILKAGGVYVPIDPGYPEARIAYLIHDAGISLLLTQSHLRLPSHQADVIQLDSEWERISAESNRNLACNVQPGHACYVIYTSGSTGNPKGVVVSHEALSRHCLTIKDHYALGFTDCVLQFASFNFDASLEQLLPALISGAAVLLRGTTVWSAAELRQQIIETGLTVVNLPTAYWQHVCQEWSHEADWPAEMRLRLMIVGGDTILPSQVRQWQQTGLSHVTLLNAYGPTETTITATTYDIQPQNVPDRIPIGRPLPGRVAVVLDAHGNLVPVGEPGELHIGGDCLARGYHRQPQLTAEGFVPPLTPPDGEGKKGERLYKTGDLARILPSGDIEFLGRTDHQVKVRGYRIELGEIEAVLGQHAAVSQVVVTVRTFRHQSLVAYIVANREQSVSELRGFLHQRLPEYMVPSLFVMLDALPVTLNGKVDRQALPMPDRKRPQLDQPYVPPGTNLERYLTDLWCDILELDQVGIHDKFFELGGDSIQAAQFINRLQDKLGESIFVVTIFDAPSIAEYAAFLQSEYADAIAKRFGGSGVAGRQGEQKPVDTHTGINHDTVTRMQSYIPRLQPDNHVAVAKTINRPAMFILAPPRSGTTLLRVMLAGHPGLFAASELNLLGFHTLRQRRTALDGRFSLWLEGTIQAIMTLKNCSADEARAIITGYEQQGYTTKQFYAVLQALCDERMLVDKTPAYALDPQALHKAEQDFEEPVYIHLVRHPYAMIRSFERVRMAQVMYLKPHPFSGRQLGELIWLISHQNIHAFLQSVPAHRQYRLRYEALVKRPSKVMTKLCETFQLAFHSAMLEPYQDMDKKMTTGIYEDSTPMGDVTFLRQRAINPQLAESWRGVLTDDFLSEMTWELARSFGYVRRQTAAGRVESNRRHRRRALLEKRRQKLR